MAKEDGRPPQIKNFADLAAALGHTPAVTPSRDARSSEVSYYQRPLLEKIHFCNSDAFRALSKSEQRERKADAFATVISMDSMARATDRVRLVVVAPTHTDVPDNEIGAKAYVLFESDILLPSGKRAIRHLGITDDLLRHHADVSRATLLATADEVKPELAHEEQSRLLLNIKATDMAIGVQKAALAGKKLPGDIRRLQQSVMTRNVSQEMERLNRRKTVLTRDFLEASYALDADPQRLPLFVVRADPNSHNHQVLGMWDLAEPSILSRLNNKTVPLRLNDSNRQFFTTFNMAILEAQTKEYITNYSNAPDQAPPHIRAAYDIVTIINRTDVKQRRRS